MEETRKNEESRAINECIEKIKKGQIAPWKVEEVLEGTCGIKPPANFKTAALCVSNL
ncbi:MAG: hypothetical protein OEW23_05355 [Candidatus Aminicenantes bacterium]|nr:hypothetical protein [Candidatus Aminicenantes bacterium]